MTTGGKISGRYTNIFKTDMKILFFVDINHAIITPGIKDVPTATLAMNVDNFSASSSKGVITIFLSPNL